MSKIRLIEWEDASPEVKEIYADIEKTRPEGLSGSFKAYANNIHVLRAEWAKSKSLVYSETLLSYELKQQIQLVASKAMGCEACIAFHSKSLRNVGVSEDGIKKTLEMDIDSPRDRTILEYAWKSCVDSLSVTDRDVARLREAGLSEEEIVEVQAMIGVGLGFSSFYDSLVLDNPA